MSLLRRMNKAHFASQQRLAGERVTYRDGETEVKNITAIRGTENRDEAYAEDAITEVRNTPWLIDVDDLPSEPSVGATITPASGDGVYEVTPGEDGRPFRHSDAERTRYRVNTMRVSDA